MLAHRLVAWLPGRSDMLQLIVGSVAVALVISSGMVWISALPGFRLSPALPASFAAMGAALFAASTRAGADRRDT
jgi:hypothetical protein